MHAPTKLKSSTPTRIKTTTRLPRASAGGPNEVAGGGLPPSPDPQSLIPDPALLPSLTAHLMDDLLDPTLTPVQICKAHGLRLDQLADIMQSDAYRKSAAAIAQISTDRTTLITNHEALRARSLQQDIARDAYLAATDLNEAAASRDPKLASTRARLLETARKANAPYAAKPAPPSQHPREEPDPKQPKTEGTSCPSPRPRGEVDPPKAETEGSSLLPRPDGGGPSQSEGEGVFQQPSTPGYPALSPPLAGQSRNGHHPTTVSALRVNAGHPQTGIPEENPITFGPPSGDKAEDGGRLLPLPAIRLWRTREVDPPKAEPEGASLLPRASAGGPSQREGEGVSQQPSTPGCPALSPPLAGQSRNGHHPTTCFALRVNASQHPRHQPRPPPSRSARHLPRQDGGGNKSPRANEHPRRRLFPEWPVPSG